MKQHYREFKQFTKPSGYKREDQHKPQAVFYYHYINDNMFRKHAKHDFKVPLDEAIDFVKHNRDIQNKEQIIVEITTQQWLVEDPHTIVEVYPSVRVLSDTELEYDYEDYHR